jgi:xylulose-5-phosphate/fructose-6-phosphate phosphoketolase
VLPVLHLNEYKIANPTLLARIPEEELLGLLRGYGYQPHVVAGDEPAAVHQALAATLERCSDRIVETTPFDTFDVAMPNDLDRYHLLRID